MITDDQKVLADHVALHLTPRVLSQQHTVVIVDDEPEVLSSLRRLLEGEPYVLQTTADPQTAIEWVKHEGVSLVIADQRMPETTGMDFLARVREACPGVSRVMLTAFPETSVIRYGLNHGVEWLIGKPWNDEALKVTLRELLYQRERSGRSGGDPGSRPPADFRERSGQRRLVRAKRDPASIREEIEARMGFFPSFFGPALGTPGMLEQLWQRTRTDYLDSPLPVLLKEKLFAYLSRFSSVPFLLVRQSAALLSAGMRGSEILSLLEEPLRALEIEVEREAVGGDPAPPIPAGTWSDLSTEQQRRVHVGSVLVFMRTRLSSQCRRDLRLRLGSVPYGQLTSLLSYIRTCLTWVESHPGLSWEADPKEGTTLQGVLREEPRMGDFLSHYRERVRKEFVARQHAVLAERDRRLQTSERENADDALRESLDEGSTILRRTSEGLFQEVVERRRTEEELRDINDILQHALEGISRLDLEGRYLSVNRAHAQMHGQTPEEMQGLSWLSQVHPEDRGRAEAAYSRMMNDGKGWCEVRAIRKDGTWFHQETVLVKAADSKNKITGCHGFMKDIGERKRAEEERHQLSAQLFLGQKLQGLGQIAAGVAHEINNPVGFVLSNLGTLRLYHQDLSRAIRAGREVVEQISVGKGAAKALSEYRRIEAEADLEYVLEDFGKAIDECRAGGERIRDIVKSLREFSHAGEGEAKPADLNRCLEDTLLICWNQFKYNVEMERDFGEMPLVTCYPERLGQVFMNLLVNAAQAIEGKGKVSLSTRLEKNQAVIRIRDNGSGIPPENLRKIFEPFFTTKPVGQGTGLGLYVAYKIIAAHGGTIEVRSEVGRGSEFVVRLPVRRGEGGEP
jgi:two-component system NtrC family sensor kinase